MIKFTIYIPVTKSSVLQAELRVLQRVCGPGPAATGRVPPSPGQRRAGRTFHPG